MSVPHTGRCPERRLLWVPEQDLLACVRCCPLPAWPSGHVFAHSCPPPPGFTCPLLPETS